VTAPARDTAGTRSLERVIHVAEFRAGLRRFLSRSERVARRRGLTPQRYLLLLMIKGAADGSERATLTELAERLQLSPNTVTELCARAEKAGLISRHAAPHDARVAYLRVTAEGDRRLTAAIEEIEADRKELSRALADLAASLRSVPRRPGR
jgi:DNA-binding MarR family transcriptional regulator